MGRYAINRAAVAAIPAEPGVDSRLHDLANTIAEESRNNIVSMGAVDTGALRDGGFVDGSQSEYTVGYDLDYAPIVHEGEGTSTSYGPRPFLGNAALKFRGRLQ